MIKRITVLITAFILVSCGKQGKEIVASDNSNFEVTKLFTADSISVYRFKDAGRYHYFTKHEAWQEMSCGKNCSYEEKISND